MSLKGRRVLPWVWSALAACGSEELGPPDDDVLPVFPGAQGFGATTPAGRGGQIIRVTNLNDTGAGSLRSALAVSGPRVIIFEVSGTIVLASNLTITNPFVTVAGQTAPSPGITLRGAGLIVSTNDVLIQHLRIRTGDDQGGVPPETRDALRLHGGSGVYNVVVDHVSASWAIDENAGTSTTGTRRDLTLSNSIISEGLSHSLKGVEHSKGILFGEGTQRVAVMRSLLAHNLDRNPYFKGGTSGVFLNNVVYNWGNRTATFFNDVDSSEPDFGSVVGNVYLHGADTPSGAMAIGIYEQNPGSLFYVADNTVNRASPPADPWSLVLNEAGSSVVDSAPPIWVEPLTVLPSETVESLVLAQAGARPADRDAVDRRIVTEVQSGTGRIIDSPSQVGGFPVLAMNTRRLAPPVNADGDGDGDGYTNLEEWLHQLAAEVE